ncbi:hypothetical protein D1007_59669 [Hordeum vulgare]|nr:hypothetical protein D1007_59669 [Hordeum vulgare]
MLDLHGVGQGISPFTSPSGPTVKSSIWKHTKLTDARLGPVTTRLMVLWEAGLTRDMVASEFMWSRIRPLQQCSQPVWKYEGRAKNTCLCNDTLQEAIL